MDGKLLNVKQAAVILFGDESRAAYQKTLRILKHSDIRTLKSGRKIFVLKSELERVGDTANV